MMYEGPMVEKSNLNGAHDGRELTGPLKLSNPDCVYQRVVENLPPAELAPKGAPSDLVCDLRLPFFGGEIPFVYLKMRYRSSRFENSNVLVKIAETSTMLDQSEIVLIGQLCERMGLDYGEIDVVRDAANKLIYVLDLNKTPLGPPNGLPPTEFARAIALYETSFLRWFEKICLLRFGALAPGDNVK